MPTYEITLTDPSETRVVSASWYHTEGDFIDFFDRDSSGDRSRVLRLRAEAVYSIERKD